MKIYIKAISYYLPKKILTNDDLVSEFPEWSTEKVLGKIGVKQRHIAEKNETASDMGFKVAEKLFLEYKIDRSTIDYILLCTQSPDYFLPTSACILQNRLKLSTSCGALDFNLGCSGFVYGLSLAKGLISAKIAKNVLLITAETYSKIIHPKDKSNRTIFGDASAATLISTTGFASIEDFSLGTDGRGADNLILKNGGFRNQNANSELTIDNLGNSFSSDYLFMNGGEIFNFTAEAVPILVEQVLNKNNTSKNNIQLYVFHQANKYMMNYLRKIIDIESEKFFFCIENTGNTVSSTIPIALYEAYKEGRIKKKSNVLIVGFGVGYSWGGTILKY